MALQLKEMLRGCMPRRVNVHRILRGPLRGKKIVTSWHDYPAAILGRTEASLLAWFQANVRTGDTWLDVGAHYGYTAIALCRLVGPHGRVFAFEPMLSTAGYVAQTRQLNNLSQMTVLPFGLAASAALEMKRLPVTRGMVDRILEKDEGQRAPRENDEGMKDEGRMAPLETVMVAQLDWLWPRVCGKSEHIDGVKIDVQGMELEALRGMIGTLSKWKPKLVVEVHVGVDRAALLKAIESAGYARRGIPVEPVAGEVRPLYLDNRSYAFFPSDGAMDNTPNP